MQAQLDVSPSDKSRLELNKILVPSDFSRASNAALNYALRFQQDCGAQLNVLHVLEAAGSPHFNGITRALTELEKQSAKTRKELRAWVNTAAAADPTAKLVVRTGIPAHEIVEAAKELDVDLIIMATNGASGGKHFCIGSTAERVVRAAPCSVLVVREKEHQFSC
jgi:universal stress protein A